MKLSLLLMLAAAQASAATPDATRTEAAHLMAAVEKSGCKFNRNGSWHDAAAARSHLQKKFDYLERKNMLTSTESFIDKGASTSSSSGKAYQMQCGAAPAITSADWLKAELKRYRQQRP